MSTPEKRREDAGRLEQFLKDEVIATALSRMERRFYEEFVNADSSEKRVTAWAKAKVLKEWERELHAALEDGQLATTEIERAQSRKTEQ